MFHYLASIRLKQTVSCQHFNQFLSRLLRNEECRILALHFARYNKQGEQSYLNSVLYPCAVQDLATQQQGKVVALIMLHPVVENAKDNNAVGYIWG